MTTIDMRLKVAQYGISNVKFNESMKNHTSFKVGGPVELFFEPESINELKRVLKFLREQNINNYIMGNGTNLLVSDKGLKGAVIRIGDRLSNVELDKDTIIAESGVLLSTLSKFAARHSLTGLEFASGIPGCLGGAIAMNAGAYDGEMKDVVEWVEVLDENMQIKRLPNSDMKFRYRGSIVEEKGYIVLKSKIRLKKGQKEEIEAKMADLTYRRTSKQPLHLPSAGSTFKRPQGYFAAKLIEDAGLKGFSVGGAQVSELHCGFVVNKGNATAQDVYNLIRHIQNTVFEKFSVKLETEVKILGEF